MTPDIKSILVPVDFSSNSARALDYAHALATRLGASLHLIHVCEVPALRTGSMDAYAIAYSNWSQQLGEEAERQLLTLTPNLTGVRVSTEVLFGNPARAIVTAAEARKPDLIVMGTHGHGALMHALMGNVAERVVRMASCPVLTVREPQEPVADRWVTKGGVVAAVVLAVSLLAPVAASPAAAQDTGRQRVTGAEIYRTYCATCHGPNGRGDGPLADSMRRKPPDLTEIAKRNGGQYPSEVVYRTIDGKQPIRGHGGPDMPVWGDAFARSRDGGDAATVKERIDTLVDFVRTLQVKPVN
ncbi:MAG: universal stress protein [Vicinamibacterales bacterium]|jgi:nucleotide-binding universal stress UspA family protein